MHWTAACAFWPRPSEQAWTLSFGQASFCYNWGVPWIQSDSEMRGSKSKLTPKEAKKSSTENCRSDYRQQWSRCQSSDRLLPVCGGSYMANRSFLMSPRAGSSSGMALNMPVMRRSATETTSQVVSLCSRISSRTNGVSIAPATTAEAL